MTPDVLFSVIIPTYNRAAFIRKTIESAISQTFTNFEIVIVDDGSTDETPAIVARVADKRVRYLRKENGERGAARNEGARQSLGQYVNFLDSDDLLYPNHLSTAYDFIRTQSDAKIFHLAYDIRNERDEIVRRMPFINKINTQILNGNDLSCNGVFIERTTFLENQFNEDRSLASLEDWELWLRMSARFPFFHIPIVTSTIVMHAGRSVVAGSAQNIKNKTEKFVQFVSEDPIGQNVHAGLLHRTYSSVFTYAALHLAMAGSRRSDVCLFLRRGLRADWRSVFTKRFLVILRFLITPGRI
jgi:glycosyltransferase involved in cell wall biosynthesis